MRALVGLTVVALFVANGPVQADTGSGDVTSDVGQLVVIDVEDGTIAAFSEFTPSESTETVRTSTNDGLRFDNGASNIQSLWDYGVGVSFVSDSTGQTITDQVTFQGQTHQLVDLVYLTPTSAGTFSPARIQTTNDLIGEGATGWTSHASCTGGVTQQGDFVFETYDNAGSNAGTTTLYYQVCGGTTIFVGSAKDLTGADSAIIESQDSAAASATEANYELTIAGNDYVFHSVAGSTVELHQGAYVPLGANQVEGEAFVLLRFPVGFPAGSFTTTITATALDIVA